jgi:hypothetical protein
MLAAVLRLADLRERLPDLGGDLGDIMLAQMRQPRRAPARQRQQPGPDRPQHVRPFRLDSAVLDQFAAQPGGLQFV